MPTPGLPPSESRVSRARTTSTPQPTESAPPRQRKRTRETVSEEAASSSSTPPAIRTRSGQQQQQPQLGPAKKVKKDQSNTRSNIETGNILHNISWFEQKLTKIHKGKVNISPLK